MNIVRTKFDAKLLKQKFIFWRKRCSDINSLYLVGVHTVNINLLSGAFRKWQSVLSYLKVFIGFELTK